MKVLPQPKPHLARRGARSSNGWGFVLLLAAVLPLQAWRATQEGTIWIDEIFTICLTHKPVDQILDITAIDRHPPLYYLALKGWITLGGAIRLSPGLFWGRAFNGISWIAMAAIVWALARRLLGPGPGALTTWMVAGGASAGWAAGDMRGYGLALTATTACFFLMMWLHVRRATSPSITESWAGWAAYAALAGIALWTHLLAGAFLIWLGAMWLILCLVSPAPGRRAFFLCGAAAHAAAVIVFVPWIREIPHQIATLGSTVPDWNTPATAENLLRVFAEWYPLGQKGYRGRWLPFLLGLGSVGLPLAGTIAAARPNRKAAQGPACVMATAGLSIAIANGMLLWLLSRAAQLAVFHGPRYTVFGATVWAAGLAGLILWAVARRGWPMWSAWVLAAPWLASSIVGQWTHCTVDARGGLPRALVENREHLPAPGADLYVMSAEAIPYFDSALSPWKIRPAAELLQAPPAAGDATIVEIIRWRQVAPAVDVLLSQAIAADAISESHQTISLKQVGGYSKIHQLRGFAPERARRVGEEIYFPPEGENGAIAGIVASADDQKRRDGWGDLEINDELRFFRWSARPDAVVRFGQPVAPGEYVLHLTLFRRPFPRESEEMRLQFEGEEDVYRVEQAAGMATMETPVRFERGHERAVLRIRHPVWTPAEMLDSDDPRELGFILFRAWLEAAG